MIPLSNKIARKPQPITKKERLKGAALWGQCSTFTGMPDSGESTDHTQTIKSGLPYHIPYHFRALKRPCPAVSNHVQPCPTMSGHVWTQVDMLIDPASGLKKSNWFAYHFRIPLYHTTSKLIKISPNTGLIPVNIQHWRRVRPLTHQTRESGAVLICTGCGGRELTKGLCAGPSCSAPAARQVLSSTE